MVTPTHVALAIALLGCGGGAGDGSDAKSEIACGVTWETSPPTDGSCDLACVEMTTGDGPACDTNIITSGTGTVICDSTFEVDGDRGCCFDLGLAGRVAGAGEPRRDRRVFFLSCAD